ncbi:phosphotransferase [soil metagenome]
MAPDMNPPAGAADFLEAHGWSDGEVLPLAGDASFRRYFRVAGHDRSAILMDAPPPHEDPRPFVKVARWLHDHGFAAPAIYAADEAQGLVLIEDFGDARMRETVDAAPESTQRLYTAAIDILIDLAKHTPCDLLPYDAPDYQREAGLLTEWYCPAIGLDVDIEGYRAAWDAALAPLLAEPGRVTVLRDYHAENLMLIENEALGLLDFQDAVAGHPAYDVVSLLQDARRDVDPALEAEMLEYYRARTGAGRAFDDAYHVLGAQRNAKIVGIFTRLWKRDGKPRYPALLPRVWGYLERDLAHPALAPVAAWFDANIPADMRGDPMVIAGE